MKSTDDCGIQSTMWMNKYWKFIREKKKVEHGFYL